MCYPNETLSTRSDDQLEDGKDQRVDWMARVNPHWPENLIRMSLGWLRITPNMVS